MTPSRSTLTLCLTVALPLWLPLVAQAQNGPVTGSMMQTDAQQTRVDQATEDAATAARAQQEVDAAAERQQAAALAARQRVLQEQVAQQQAAAEAARQRVQQAGPAASTPAAAVAPAPAPAAALAAAPATTTAPSAAAADRPVVRQQPNPAAAPAPVAQSTPQPVPQPTLTGKQHNGDVSRSVLQMQAEGRYAGPPVPTLGATARLSWERYVQSFRQPIPEFYPTNSQPK